MISLCEIVTSFLVMGKDIFNRANLLPEPVCVLAVPILGIAATYKSLDFCGVMVMTSRKDEPKFKG
jgi:hypothetical protein